MPRRLEMADLDENGWILGGKIRVNPGKGFYEWSQNKRRFLKLVQESHGW